MKPIRRGQNPIKVPFAIKTSDPVMREWVGETREAIRNLASRLPQGPAIPLLGGGGSSNRFRFGGLYKDEEDVWRVRIGVGAILYHRTTTKGDFDQRKRQRQFVRGIFPTIDVDGNKVRIDDPSKPGLELGGRESAAVWLVVKKEKCDTGSSIDNERLEISNRDEEPEIESSEDAFQIVEFDVEDGEGDSKKATEVYKYLQSDLIQNYSCEKADSDSDSYNADSEFGSSFYDNSSSSGIMDSTPSGSSDEDSDDNNSECQITCFAGWENAVTCFPKAPGAGTAPIPAPMDVRIRVKFSFKQPWGGVQCAGYIYGVQLSGGEILNPTPPSTAYEHRWRNDVDRELDFHLAYPPACGTLTVTWRVRALPAIPAFGETEPPEDQGCCNQMYPFGGSGTVTVVMRDAVTTGPWKASKTKMPPVCGHNCSSAIIGGGGGSDSTP